ncbi:MAG: sulfite exporter TauE/SafE family protein [Candidatus Omnitrophica bacterium]|nr:sulfite exporter TauE/SafE family protein [Candidatus Omnitrophota bacterium]
MNQDLAYYSWVAATGIATGFLSGLLGVGGGVVMVPIFMYVFKTDVHTAIGTSLAVIVPTALMGALKHYSQQSLDFRLFWIVSIFALLGAFAGAHVSLGAAAPVLKKTFAVFLFCLSIYIYVRG